MSADLSGALLALVLSVLATVLASATALFLKLRRDRMKAQLGLVSDQLRYFYGPLLAHAEANERAWSVFMRRYNPEAGRNFWSPAHPPLPEAISAWHHWVTSIFMPTNRAMVDVVIARSDLLIPEKSARGDDALPACLADLCGHVRSLEAELASWTPPGQHGNATPPVPPYPADQLLGYLRYSFSQLKRDQVRLLRATVADGRYPTVADWKPQHLLTDPATEHDPGQPSESAAAPPVTAAALPTALPPAGHDLTPASPPNHEEEPPPARAPRTGPAPRGQSPKQGRQGT
jgi:hypothetical protein